MKILTALGTEELNNKLKKEENIELIGKDVQYQEGVLDILERNRDTDILAISNLLPEEMEFCFLIDKIRKEYSELEIVVFLDKENIGIENFLNSKKIYRIYYLDENGIEVFVNSLRNNNKVSLGISREIEGLKEIIMNTKEEAQNTCIPKENRIITITGNPGSGKSIIACLLAKQFEKQKKSVAIVECSSLVGSIGTILGIQEEDKIKKYSKYIDVYTFSTTKITRNEICSFFESIKNDYEFIIIDIEANERYDNIKTILKCSDKVAFLLEPNLLGIAKAKKLLEIFTMDFEIGSDKIKIVFNKSNKYQIEESILEEVFSNFESIGNISYDEKYDSFINKHLSLMNDINLYEIIYEN